ncbi:MAG: ABC transporter permease subunit, partial [Planctomycetaceae bacterium]|nr:ABC transporter permease subunit [Planctomycetaceae bacterium]
MNWRNVLLIFRREVLDQVRDRRTLFMILVLPVLLYPAMGVGIVPLIQFAEQPRTLVLLGADALPEPKLLDGEHFAGEWFRDPSDRSKLVVVSDAAIGPAEAETVTEERRRRLLETARKFRGPLERQVVLNAQFAEAVRVGDQPAMASLGEQRKALAAELSQPFAASGMQVLVVVPPDFAEHIRQMQDAAANRQVGAITTDYPRPILLRNSADEKSAMAAIRVQKVLSSWEHAILQNVLREVGLPEELPQPVNPTEVDLAAENELAANVWSKLFPALLMMMALTGAFYPAIDLGAGEKERGTMETLLICPATRTEIVIGKFFTVMLFSMATALLNLSSAGLSGKYMLSLTGGSGGLSRLGDLSLPPMTALVWVLVLLVPLSALFSALCLALATFAKS